MKNGLPYSGKKRFCKSTLPERLMEECAAMSSAGIIGAIQIKLNWRERGDAGLPIDRQQQGREQQGRSGISVGADGPVRDGVGAVPSVGDVEQPDGHPGAAVPEVI
jgi:hypothetical protein